MTKKEQDEKLYEIGQKVREIFPDTYGSVRFNLHPKKTTVNVNIEEARLIEK